MVLGALVDAGCPLSRLREGLLSLRLTDWEIQAEKVWKNGMSATWVRVRSGDGQKHRSLDAILELIRSSGLDKATQEMAAGIFRRLGEAEAKVHDVPIEKIHFHEVGAVDSIVDIVGTAIGLNLLRIERFICSALNVGAGTVKTAHGILPVPAPATAELLRGRPTYSSGVICELVTPTGAAIVSTLCAEFGAQPEMTVGAIGYGAGTADLPGQPNVLRVLIGEAAEAGASPGNAEEIAVIEANIDDMNPQIFGYFLEKALGAGALDVFTTSVTMKKSRPGALLTVLCRPEQESEMAKLIFAETTTIGIRTSRARRRVLPREWINVSTQYGEVRVKIARANGKILQVAPEYEDCRKLASEQDVPLQHVLSAALRAFHEKQAGG